MTAEHTPLTRSELERALRAAHDNIRARLAENERLREALRKLLRSCDGEMLGTVQAPQWAIACYAEAVLAGDYASQAGARRREMNDYVVYGTDRWSLRGYADLITDNRQTRIPLFAYGTKQQAMDYANQYAEARGLECYSED